MEIKLSEVDKFIENLKSYGLGKTLEKMASKQPEIVEAVHDTGLQGTLTLTLKFKRAGQSGIAVTAAVVGKPPERPFQMVEMFKDEFGALHEENPDQVSFGENVHDINEGGEKKLNQA